MSIRLKVDEANKNDVGRQIARIPAEIADQLNLKTGDVIELKGKRKTYTKTWRTNPALINSDTIRIEAIIRKNAGVNLDEYVAIKPAKIKIANLITYTLIEEGSFEGNLTSFLKKLMIDKVLTSGDIFPINSGFGKTFYISIKLTKPDGPILVNSKTIIKEDTEIVEEVSSVQNDISSIISRIPKTSYEDIGGHGDTVKKIREMIELPLRYPQIFERLGIQPPKGVLLYGPPGTGKTLLARAIASETSSYFLSIGGPEIISKFYGETENRLRDIFEEARNNNPAIIFIDEIDSIAPKRENVAGEVEHRIVAQLLALMDGLEQRGNIVVIGATNRPDSIDQALRRGGRFDREIEIGIPNQEARLEIFEIHTRGMPLSSSVQLKILAQKTHGFVGADIATVAKEAALASLHRFLPEFDLTDPLSLQSEMLEKLTITMNDFDQALKITTPSALREVFIELPNVKWASIGGLDNIKSELVESVEWPLKYPDIFNSFKLSMPSGILLYGPPGTGKTMLAKALANETSANFISIKGPELLSKWIGESEKGIREIFRKARVAAPCIVFIDEIDSISSTRDNNHMDSVITRIISQILIEIDGLDELNDVLVLGATNRPDVIDPALLRPGRFDKIIFVPNPEASARMDILNVYLQNLPLANDIDLDRIVDLTKGYSGAEIKQIVDGAKMIAIKEIIIQDKTVKTTKDDLSTLSLISNDHLLKSIEKNKPRNKNSYNLKPPGISDIGYA